MDSITKWLERAEGLLYVLTGILLVVVALVILGHATGAFIGHLSEGEFTEAVVTLLEELLLGMMAIELLYTVTVSMRTRSLSAEPFLVVGLVAAVRRILTLSVEAATLFQTDVEKFKMALYEIGLLTFAVLILVISIHILRRCKQVDRVRGVGEGTATA